jgi:hypothetical protein
MKEEVKSIMDAIQSLVRVLYLKGLEHNDVHNIVEVAKSRAYDEFYEEK